MTQKGVNWTEYNLKYEEVGDYKVLTDGREEYLKYHPEGWTEEEKGDKYVKKPN